VSSKTDMRTMQLVEYLFIYCQFLIVSNLRLL